MMKITVNQSSHEVVQMKPVPHAILAITDVKGYHLNNTDM
jgi:hypothetical protein